MQMPRRGRARARVAALAALAALAFGLACRSAVTETRVIVGTGVAEALRAQGSAPVVIALLEPTGLGTTGDDAARRRAEIARMQQAVLAALDSADYRSRVLFESVPAMAGTLRTQRGLDILLAHPSVRRVDLDTGGSGGDGT